ncbi:LPS-assembly lipoprotein LptE [Thalassotalea insulae]|uniref:LPS-assembly lipoprotein LptE n=1 Tax=Thalassotalea insulae TaxID=2056778 RepID=A0ABQ6GPI6_9GAMM|nr:LPS assembly lipoprotein LptE [Thalassotalea insulae]GLX77519.1 LPS-assembly lipoprotein LptE [Thalassotalea insulae]
MKSVGSHLLTKIKVYSLVLATLALCACGFRLRGDYLLAPELQHIYLSSVDQYGELTQIVKRHLQHNQVTLAQQFSDKLPQMRILKDKLDRRTLSVFPNGQVAEYELIYTVRYQLIVTDQDTQHFKFEINRNYQDDPNLALAKSRELALMLSEMRKEAADRILRSMASIHPS